MNPDFSTRLRISIVLLITIATVSFHYGFIIRPTDGTGVFFHAIHGRLCYIPIILGAIWFGVRGGLAISLLVIALTLPYGKFRHIHESALLLDEYTEMVFYLAIGLTSGILIELQRKERKKSEALTRELSRKEHLSSLGQMAAGLAHEIKNPLGSIKGSAEILNDDFPPGTRKHELLQVLAKETGRLNRVVEDFLSFARPRPLQLVPANINTLLEDVISQIEIETKNEKVRIMKKFDHGITEAPFDIEKLHQVFLNITLNAISAMTEAGVLSISSEKKFLKGQESIIISINDTGEGIPAENLEKIFNPFFTTRSRGTGLGLSISHMIIQGHGGRIEVESRLGEGSEFRIVLPVNKENKIETRHNSFD